MGLISRVSSRTYREDRNIIWRLDKLSSERSSRGGRNLFQPKTYSRLVSPKFRGITWPTHKVHSVIRSRVQSTSQTTCQPKAPEPRTIPSSSQHETRSE